VNVVEGMHAHIKSVSRVVKDSPAKWRAHRAKRKLTWLKKHDFLSDQERYLTSEVTG